VLLRVLDVVKSLAEYPFGCVGAAFELDESFPLPLLEAIDITACKFARGK
jgi:hypothetical protein